MNFALFHGGGQGSWVWDETVAALRLQAGTDALNILTLDVPGCGTKRDREITDLSLNDVAQELVSEIEGSGLEDVVLVGHSQAGQAMALMATIKPHLFRRFIYVSCSIPLPGQSVQQMIGVGIQGSDPDTVGWPLDPESTTREQQYQTMFCNDMDEETMGSFLIKLGRDQWPLATYKYTAWAFEHLREIPSTFVLCLRDSILPASWQQVFAERFKCERTVTIDAGHQVMTTRPHGLAEVLRIEAR